MPALKDRTGQKYNRLTVLKRAPNKGTQVCWECLCDCGNICVVSGNSLQTGHTKSCGCLNTETRQKLGQSNKKSLVGQKFGKLLVIKDLETRANPDSINYSHLYECQCDCGNIVTVRDNNLRSGNTLSCGCLSMSHGEYMIKELLIRNNINYIQEYRILNNDINCRFDFAIIENSKIKCFIEYDGRQHFMESGGIFEGSYEYTHQRDLKKNQYCFEHNIPLIRIPYTVTTITLEDMSKYLLTKENEESYYAI